VHDFTGGIAPNGLLWIVQVPDDAVQTKEDGTLTISLTNAAIVDQIAQPGSFFAGSTGHPATLTLNMTFQKHGRPRIVRPTSASPISPHSWAGEMSDATYSGTFSVAYTDGKFSAHGDFGSMASDQIFAEMGKERNGSFVEHEDQDENEQAAAAMQSPGQASASVAAGQLSASATLPANSPKWHGKVPVEYLFH
jgi:hypothetical protein